MLKISELTTMGWGLRRKDLKKRLATLVVVDRLSSRSTEPLNF